MTFSLGPQHAIVTPHTSLETVFLIVSFAGSRELAAEHLILTQIWLRLKIKTNFVYRQIQTCRSDYDFLVYIFFSPKNSKQSMTIVRINENKHHILQSDPNRKCIRTQHPLAVFESSKI